MKRIRGSGWLSEHLSLGVAHIGCTKRHIKPQILVQHIITINPLVPTQNVTAYSTVCHLYAYIDMPVILEVRCI